MLTATKKSPKELYETLTEREKNIAAESINCFGHTGKLAFITNLDEFDNEYVVRCLRLALPISTLYYRAEVRAILIKILS